MARPKGSKNENTVKDDFIEITNDDIMTLLYVGYLALKNDKMSKELNIRYISIIDKLDECV